MKKAIRFLVPVLMILAILVSILWYLFVYDRAFTRDTLLNQARFQDQHGNSRISSLFYNMAYAFSGKDEDVAIELANQYKEDGNFTKAEYTLTNAINTTPTVELYIALCETYVEQDKLMDAVNLLDNIRDPEVKARLDALRPSAPQTDYPAGYYNQYMNIHLSSTGDSIYYTTNGEYPSVEDPVYDIGISLPAGETTVYALSVNDTGLVSPATVLAYTITGVIEPVEFTDPAMEAAIRELVGASAGDTVMTNQLWEIKEFTVPSDVKSFEDLSQLPYLTKLTIHDQKIDSLSHLSSLARLSTLDLSGCRFPADELSVLANLPGLVELSLSDCGLSTIAGLAGAQGLNLLDLSSNTLRNLEVIAAMSDLNTLLLGHNAVTDLSSLSGLSELTTLDISYNSISSLAPLASCVKLDTLNASNNQIESLDGLDSLILLTSLDVHHNALEDVSNLSGLTDLKTLNISSNALTDISPLSSLTKLETFNFSYNEVESLPDWPEDCVLQTINGAYNQLKSVAPLKGIASLTNVNLDYNSLTSVDDLADCFCLVYVNVYGNEIGDVSKLREKDIIVNYDPTVK